MHTNSLIVVRICPHTRNCHFPPSIHSLLSTNKTVGGLCCCWGWRPLFPDSFAATCAVHSRLAYSDQQWDFWPCTCSGFCSLPHSSPIHVWPIKGKNSICQGWANSSTDCSLVLTYSFLAYDEFLWLLSAHLCI